MAIILAVSVSIVINTTVDSVTKDYKSRFGAEVTLFLNTEIAKRHTNVQYPTAQQQMEIAKSDLLQRRTMKAPSPWRFKIWRRWEAQWAATRAFPARTTYRPTRG